MVTQIKADSPQVLRRKFLSRGKSYFLRRQKLLLATLSLILSQLTKLTLLKYSFMGKVTIVLVAAVSLFAVKDLEKPT